MLRFGWVLALPLALAALASFMQHAQAADAPDPKACVRAYAMTDGFRSRVRDLEYSAKKPGQYHGLGAYSENFDTIDFGERADALVKRFPDKVGKGYDAFTVALGESDKMDALQFESISVYINVFLAAEKVLSGQREILTLVHACDIAFAFSPVLGEPPNLERTVSLYREKIAGDREATDRRIAALDDTACAVRFVVTANLFPAGGPEQATLMQHADAAARRIRAAQPGLDPQRLLQTVQRDGQQFVAFLQSKRYTPEMLVEDVRGCQSRFGLPLTDIKVN